MYVSKVLYQPARLCAVFLYVVMCVYVYLLLVDYIPPLVTLLLCAYVREQEGDQTKGLTQANGDLSTLIENSECNFVVHVHHNNNNNKCTSQYLSLPG